MRYRFGQSNRLVLLHFGLLLINPSVDFCDGCVSKLAGVWLRNGSVGEFVLQFTKIVIENICRCVQTGRQITKRTRKSAVLEQGLVGKGLVGSCTHWELFVGGLGIPRYSMSTPPAYSPTAGRALEICDRRRRRRRRRDEGCLIDDLKRYTPSTETRSVSADPGGRTDGRHGLNSRLQEWSRLPEPYPPQAGYWCSRFARRPNVRLIWCGNDQIMELGSDLGCRNSQRSFPHAPLNLTPPLDSNIPM